MNAYIPTQDELEDIVSRAVTQTMEQTLPAVIRKATRKRWLTTGEVMEMLQCSRRHVQHLRDTEQLSYSQNGRTIRYQVEDVEAFLNSHKIKSREYK